MKIGEVAQLAGLPAKTIRYYEDVGLLPPAIRQINGYRDFGEREVHVLRFLQRARSLGFSVAECRELLDLYWDRERSSADVKAIAMRRLADIERKIAELESLRHTLSELARRCRGDERPDCPILDELSGND